MTHKQKWLKFADNTSNDWKKLYRDKKISLHELKAHLKVAILARKLARHL